MYFLEPLALVIVLLTAAYLVAIAMVSVFWPLKAIVFLNSFASSACAHITEMTIRLLVGGSLIIYSPRMLYSEAFRIFGWLLVVTSVLLLMIPWQWHQRFAKIAVAPLTRRVWIFGLFALPLGVVILLAVLYGFELF